jgi:Pvc16 N-terminal domain/Carboxypeptidase regulatory-like domain
MNADDVACLCFSTWNISNNLTFGTGATMFQDLDKTLQALIEDPAAPAALRNADVSFETPDKNFTPGQATLNLFLHEVKENRDLRDPEPVQVFENGLYSRRLPPLRVACGYLVTGWSTQTGALRVAEEHQLLGEALGWLSGFATIPARFFQGAMSGQAYPPPTMVAQLEGGRTLGEFWTALGVAPRPAFTLMVTVALALAVEHPLGPAVTAHEVRLGLAGGPLEGAFLIGGTVRAADSDAPLAAAGVTIRELGRTLQTDAAGRYRFAGLAAGSYTLRAIATGFAPLDKPVKVPATVGEAYDIALNSL